MLLYVDYMLVASKSKSDIREIKDMLKSEFDMKELGPARIIVDMEICRDRRK